MCFFLNKLNSIFTKLRTYPPKNYFRLLGGQGVLSNKASLAQLVRAILL